MKTFDGLKLLVQFYANNGALRQVEERSGVKVARLKGWLAGRFELTDEERKQLEQSADKGSKPGKEAST